MIVILSSNEDPNYLSFWPWVSQAYKLMGFDCHLALLTWRDAEDPFIQALAQYGKITLFRPIGWIAEFGQAKMIRFLLAAQYGDEEVYIDDIDLFPLSKSFITDKTEKRPKGHLLLVGGEVYENNGCYPMSQITGEGYLFKQIFNPNDLPYDHLIEQWSTHKYDPKEDISIRPDWSKWEVFSDEKLLRRLREENPVPYIEVERGYADFLDATLDRYNWNIDINKLHSQGYVNAHCVRPAVTAHMQTLLDYVRSTYAHN